MEQSRLHNGVLILGYSRIVCKRVLPALLRINSLKQIEIASKSSQERTTNFKEYIKYSDYFEALQKSSCNWVYISLANGLHEKYARLALEYNKNVIIDKPITLAVEDSKNLLRLAKERGLVLSESVVYHHHRQFEYLKALLKTNKTETCITSIFQFPSFGKDDFRNDPELGGGAFWDLNAYTLSVGRLIFHEAPRKIYSATNCIGHQIVAMSNFSILAEYSHGNMLIGLFGVGFEYRNSIEVANRSMRIELCKPFSITQYEDAVVKVTSDNEQGVENLGKDDTFYNYFDYLFSGENASGFERERFLNQIWKKVELGISETEMLLRTLGRK